MAKIARGISYSENEYITAAKLHALVDTAIAGADGFPGTPDIYDIVFLNFVSGIRPFHTASSPAAPVLNDLAVGSDGMLDRYDGAAFVDAERDYLNYVNGSAITLVTGTPVVADVAAMANCTIWPGPGACPDPLGVSMGVYAPSATAAIKMFGVAIMRVNSPFSVVAGDLLTLAAAGATALTRSTAIAPQSNVMAVVMNVDTANPLSGDVLAVLVR